MGCVFFSLKLECEKLASEKTEMQRHYVMVRSFVTLSSLSPQRGWSVLEEDAVTRSACSGAELSSFQRLMSEIIKIQRYYLDEETKHIRKKTAQQKQKQLYRVFLLRHANEDDYDFETCE